MAPEMLQLGDEGRRWRHQRPCALAAKLTGVKVGGEVAHALLWLRGALESSISFSAPLLTLPIQRRIVAFMEIDRNPLTGLKKISKMSSPAASHNGSARRRRARLGGGSYRPTTHTITIRYSPGAEPWVIIGKGNVYYRRPASKTLLDLILELDGWK